MRDYNPKITDSQFEEFVKKYNAQRARFEALKPGDLIYEISPQGMMDFDVFEMEVIEVDVSNRLVTVKDHSLHDEIKVVQDFCNSEEVKRYL